MTNDATLDHFKPSSGTFEVEDFPFYWVAKLANIYTHRMEAILKKEGINITSWRVCMILREQGTLSMSDLAAHSVSRLPTITKCVYKLQDQGLVTIKPSPEDARVSLVNITAQGKNKVVKLLNLTSRLFDHAFEGLKAKELQQMNKTMIKLLQNLS